MVGGPRPGRRVWRRELLRTIGSRPNDPGWFSPISNAASRAAWSRVMLQSIRILNFRSCVDCKVDFNESVSALVGRNGVGKTNILRAIEWLARTAATVEAPKLDFFLHEEGEVRFSANAPITTTSCLFVPARPPGSKTGSRWRSVWTSRTRRIPLV